MATSLKDEFLSPQYLPSSLDGVVVRQAILAALRSHLTDFRGVVLDVGCGYMPYKSLVLSPPSRAEKYIGLDLKENLYQKPDIDWDGRTIPLEDCSVDCALATEVFEHCPDPEIVMREALRVLKPGGFLFFTIPFLWPLHDVPHDEYRYTPYAIERHLRSAGFAQIGLKPLGGWDASLAQMLGLWVRRRPLSPRKRAILSKLALPLVRYLYSLDHGKYQTFQENSMITGLSGIASKPNS